MIKSWLITTSAPFCGTEQYYRAYSKENPIDIDEVNDWFWNIETMNLWDWYGYKWEDNWDDEYEESEIDDYDEFIELKLQEWQEECNIECEECSEEEFKDYAHVGEELEIIYDERNSANSQC